MKRRLSLFLFSFISILSFSQEICDNAIDDDGDGLIDLNDDECDCAGFGTEIESLIPNPSFEETDCCPSTWSQLTCATTWIQASDATSDYMNTCDWTGDFYFPAEFPLPGGGDGYVAFLNLTSKEYIGACLDGPLLAGTTYTLKLYTAWGGGADNLNLTIFGTPNCGDLPWTGFSCPTGVGDWEELSSESVTYVTDGSWQEVEYNFTPSVDINAVSIGPDCAAAGGVNYYYLDELRLLDSTAFDSGITEEGDWCDGTLVLTANSDSIGGTWQWYKEGIALIGETGETVNTDTYGLGEYSAIYTIGDNCLRLNRFVLEPTAIAADFEASLACLGGPTEFTNTSVYTDAVSPTWEWDFGGDGTSTDENPAHTFSAPGTYTVELIAINDVGCNDTIEIDVTVDPVPVADFEFVVAGVSSQDGSTGGCIENTVQFNDISTIASPGEITSWDWDFGGDGSSIEENPEHIFSAPGTYTISLTVETDNGCSSTFELDIIMTASLELDISFGQPSCFGYTDGSVTVNVTGATGDINFVITDETGTVINEGNSNVANTLGTGWYYFNVSDESLCDGIDSVFVPEPEQLSADYTISTYEGGYNVACHGGSSGWVNVDTVEHWQGDYGQIAYFWEPNPIGMEGIGIDSVYNMTAGEYVFTINDDNGCTRVYTFEITEPTPMTFAESGTIPAQCRVFDYQNGNGVVFAAVAGGVADYEYLWENLETGATSVNSTWGGLNPGCYEITATDENFCVLKDTICLDSIGPIAQFDVISDELNEDLQGTAPVEASFVNQSINYEDDFDPLWEPTFFWNMDTTTSNWFLTNDYFDEIDTLYSSRGASYTVDVCLTVLNSNGCEDTECKLITIYEDIAFDDVNIFSPNGDGINDLFTFEFKSASISEFTCVIVNRWGVTVNEINDINSGWDGTDKNGDPCTNGVYFYTYRAITDNSNILEGQGNIQLVGPEE